MGERVTVRLDKQSTEFVATRVADGSYASAEDVVRAGLDLLQERESERQALQSALREGEESGSPNPFDFDAFLRRKRTEASAE